MNNIISLPSCDREYTRPMLREKGIRAPKVGVKQLHKESPFNKGQDAPDSIVSALSFSPGILYSNMN